MMGDVGMPFLQQLFLHTTAAPGTIYLPNSWPNDGTMRLKDRQVDLTSRIIACVIRVHQTLGPGFLENIYKRALLMELQSRGLVTEVEKEIVIYYKGAEVGRHRLDLVVERRIIIELKTVECLSRAHYAQIRSYLKASGLELGLLINFAGDQADFRRVSTR